MLWVFFFGIFFRIKFGPLAYRESLPLCQDHTEPKSRQQEPEGKEEPEPKEDPTVRSRKGRTGPSNKEKINMPRL